MTRTPDHRPLHIVLSCGEASGERYGAALVRALRELEPDVRLTGMGGPALADAGVELAVRSDDLGVMGVTDVVSALPRILGARSAMRRHASESGADIVVPVDLPGFNVAVARAARDAGVPVYYVVAPQLWAWGGWRIGGLRKAVDRIGTLLPFERDFFETRGVACDRLGHPLMDDYDPKTLAPAEERRERVLRDPARPVRLGLLPGSRRQELTALAPLFAEAVDGLKSRCPDRTFQLIASAAPGVPDRWLEPMARAGADVVRTPLPRLLPDLDLAVVCSGTASLEASLAGTPHALVYRTSALNYALARRLVRVDRIGLANLITDVDMAREHIQGAATPDALADDLAVWIRSTVRRRRYAGHVAGLRGQLGEPGFWHRTAAAVIGLARERTRRER